MSAEIRQLSVFVENHRGELTDVTSSLKNESISIKSLNLVDSSDFGILRLIVDQPDEAKKVLDSVGFSLRITSVFAVEIDDHIGSFNEVAATLSSNGINIEYTYTINSGSHGAFIFKVSQGDFSKALEVLQNANVVILDGASL